MKHDDTDLRTEAKAELIHSESAQLKDAIDMLSVFYFRIVKIDLATGHYVLLRDSSSTHEEKETFDQYETITERWQKRVASGFIYDEDIERYLEFWDLDRLRHDFDENRDRIFFTYRRKMEGEYRWVSACLARSGGYTPESPVIILYLRDINDSYLEQLNSLMLRTNGAIGSVALNVSKGYCYRGQESRSYMRARGNAEPWSDYVDRICNFVGNKTDRKKAQKIFSQENLLGQFAQGKESVSFEASSEEAGTSRFRRYRAVLDMVRNLVSQDVEGVLYIVDITSRYLSERLPRLLYQNNYKTVGIISAKRESITLERTSYASSAEQSHAEMSYPDFAEKIAEGFVLKTDLEYFRSSAKLERVIGELERVGYYSFTFKWVGKDGNRSLINVRYLYFDRDYKMILMCTEDVTDLSNRDTLTGGHNRQGFVNAVRAFLDVAADRSKYAICFFNICNFKAVNELWGRDTGDEILKDIYSGLEHSYLNPIVLCRIEVDHFVCLVKKSGLNDGALFDLCKRTIVKDRKTVYLSIRCGIYEITEQKMDVEGMIDRAKLAIHYIKDEYVSPYRIYDISMKQDYINKANLPGMFEKGMMKGEFEVYYQPVVEASTGKVVSAEALTRWKHPEDGLISPSVFIPALEENGSITELDWYVMKQVCAFMRKRVEAGLPIVPVSINLSWMDFYDEIMMEDVLHELEDCKSYGLELRVEITETSYAAIGEGADRRLQEMRKKGGKLLMDDFGSGYSSFGILQEHSFDILKIDISFVRKIETSPKTRSILKFMIQMGHALGMKIVAEGAETYHQVSFLKENGCDFIQGYYYSRPLSQSAFIEYLEQQ